MEGTTINSTKVRFIESKQRYRISSHANDLLSLKLITSANKHGFLVIGTPDNSIRGIPTNDLFDFSPSKDRANAIDFSQFLFNISLTFKPTLLTVARYGFSNVLLVIGQNIMPQHPVVEAFDLDTRSSIGKLDLSNLTDATIVDYAWHPNYYDSIVALCSSQGDLLIVGINKATKAIARAFSSREYGAITCCWSPKGKNLAIGLINGSVRRIEPVITATSFTFKAVDKSTLSFQHPSLTPQHRVVKLRWVNKTYLMSAHAKVGCPSGAETIFSLFTVRPDKPYKCWTNVCYESQVNQNYQVHLINLSYSVICASNSSGEAALIGIDGANQATLNDLKDWHSIIIEEEGARIELPLDVNNIETSALSATVALKDNRPVLIFYTSDGVICSYQAVHSENIFSLPEFQPELACPYEVKASFTQGSLFGQPSSGLGGGSIFGSPLGSSPSATANTMLKPSGLSFLSGSSPQQATFGSTSWGSQPQTSSLFSGLKPTFGSSPQGPLSSLSLTSQSNFPTWNQQPAQQLNQPQPQTPQQQPEKLTSSITPQQPIPQLQSFSLQQPQTLQQLPNIQQTQPKQQTPQLQPAPQTHAPQPQQNQPIQLTKPPQSQPLQPKSLPQQQQEPQPQSLFQLQPQSQPKEKTVSQPKSHANSFATIKKELDDEIAGIKRELKLNSAHLSTLEEVHHLREKFENVMEVHQASNDVVADVKSDINKLDLSMLENLYLIEFIKLKEKNQGKKTSIDPASAGKIEKMKKQLKILSDALLDLNLKVEVAWEEQQRSQPKDHATKTLDIIYKTLANNQKFINVLKQKLPASSVSKTSSVAPKTTSQTLSRVVEANMSSRSTEGLARFKEFLSSRQKIPVRRPQS